MNKQYGYPYDLRNEAPPTPVYVKDSKGHVLRIEKPEYERKVKNGTYKKLGIR